MGRLPVAYTPDFSRYAIVQLGLVGPLYQVSRTLANEVSFFLLCAYISVNSSRTLQLQRQATARLREHFREPILAEPVRARTQSAPPEHEDLDEELRTRQL